MRVLVACEESQVVCTAFRRRGHEAYSADIQEPSGGHPEWSAYLSKNKLWKADAEQTKTAILLAQLVQAIK